MVAIENHSVAEIVRVFLKSPLDRKAFDRFFGLCYSEAILYLRILRSLGWKIPEYQVQHERAISDIAIDLLGPFLASRKERPFFVVFEYFQRHGLSDPDQIDPEALCRRFVILLRGFIRRELTYIRGLENPQIKNLKRRIKDILTGPEYGSRLWPNEKDESCFAVENADRLRFESPPISSDCLYRIVRDAFDRSCTRTEWCSRIFRLLDRESEFRNAVELPDLISAMVAVNAEFIDAAHPDMKRISTPAEDLIDRQMSETIDETIIWLKAEVVDRFCRKGRISEADAILMLKASRAYLEDYNLSGNEEDIPKYFLNLRPGLSRAEYQKRYKYILETAIKQGLGEFRKRLRKELTIWPFGNY